MKVYAVNEYEWYMAPTLEEAVAKCMADCGLSRDEAVDDPVEVSEEMMRTLIFVDFVPNPDPPPPTGSLIDFGWEPVIEVRRTFAEELSRRVAAGERTQAFASTEF